MEEHLKELGIGAILALLILDKFIAYAKIFVEKRKLQHAPNGEYVRSKECSIITKQLKETIKDNNVRMDNTRNMLRDIGEKVSNLTNDMKWLKQIMSKFSSDSTHMGTIINGIEHPDRADT